MALLIFLLSWIIALAGLAWLLLRRQAASLTGTLSNPLTTTRVGQLLLPLKDGNTWIIHVTHASPEAQRLVGRNVGIRFGKDFPSHRDYGRIKVSVLAQYAERVVTLHGTLTGGDDRPYIEVASIESDG